MRVPKAAAIFLPGYFIFISSFCLALALEQRYEDEALDIMKRFAQADQVFEGHDVARVHLEQGQGQGRKRLNKRDLRSIIGNFHDDNEGVNGDDATNHFHLELLSSGTSLSLTLTPARIVDADTSIYFRSANESAERVEREHDATLLSGCFSYGQIQDSTGQGWASISHCDGVFGFANSPGFDYFLHPASSNDANGKRQKREAMMDDDVEVHVVWRKTESSNAGDLITGSIDDNNMADTNDDDDNDNNDDNNKDDDPNNEEDNGDNGTENEDNVDVIVPREIIPTRKLKGSDEDRLNATEVVVELAMFTDAEYWKQLHHLYPGRENEFLITRLAGTQALYSNRDKTGYDVKFKLKHLEHWKTNPIGYNFTQKLATNLRSFCKYTRKKYFYDIHALNTGVVFWNKGHVGLAYLGGACSRKRCLVSKGFDIKTFVLYAHEIGHTLGMPHHDTAKCPEDIKSVGGFMGGGSRYNFSPCMKHEITKFFSSSKSNCLFKESAESTTPEEFHNLPNLFPGQLKTPDEMCQIMAGPDFNYVPLRKLLNVAACEWFLCLNENETDAAFGRVRRFRAATGFPCSEESFCTKDPLCMKWDQARTTMSLKTLRHMTHIPEWSEWSSRFTSCSRSCGTGLRVRKRQCQFQGFNLSPYCPGYSIDARLCNTDPCPRDPKKKRALRRVRGNEVCSRFLKGGVQLKLSKKAKAYAPVSVNVKTRDAGAKLGMLQSKSCLLKCRRKPAKVKGDLDAFMPDGTPCYDSIRSFQDNARLGIELRCVRGFCREFTDCPDRFQVKDKCGVCGGNGSRCVELTFDSAFNVPRGKHSYLTKIPEGSSNIEIRLQRKKNKGVYIELWSNGGEIIIGVRGRYSKAAYRKSNAVRFAGTRWLYQRKDSYLRASGPITEPVIIRAHRQSKPITLITAKYVLAENNDVQTPTRG